jgi:hypothetical protein
MDGFCFPDRLSNFNCSYLEFIDRIIFSGIGILPVKTGEGL